MKRILVIFAAALTIVCANPLKSWAMQPCPIFDPPNIWTNCIGKKKVDLLSTYHGGFKNGKFHGKGTLTRSDGTIQKGHWKNGVLIASPSLKIVFPINRKNHLSLATQNRKILDLNRLIQTRSLRM